MKKEEEKQKLRGSLFMQIQSATCSATSAPALALDLRRHGAVDGAGGAPGGDGGASCTDPIRVEMVEE